MVAVHSYRPAMANLEPNKTQRHATCPTCDTLIPSSDTDGLCPKCLLGVGLSTAGDADAPTLAGSQAGSALPHRVSGSFGDYELIREIARGGMGVVYEARDRKLNRNVALKMILTGQFASDGDVRRFYQEAEAAANLDHSGIVPIYEVGEKDGRHFFSMKLLDGGALSAHLPELRKDTRQIVALIAKVARAVHYAHQRGILHRDLKPANILLDENGEPMITDLGLAKDVGSQSDLTQTGAVLGTPAYMPPEQAAGEKDVTTAADIYSIGAILYEALTGRTPFAGESPMAVVMKVINETPRSPREVDSNINRTLELICMKCLQRDPNARYSSAAALADDLENWIEGRPVSAKPPSITSVLGDLVRDSLQSAIGAALVGGIAGWIVGFGVFPSSPKWAQLDADFFAALSAVTGEVADERNMQFLLWFAPYGLWCAAFALVFVGFGVQWIVRPKTRELAIGLGGVASAVMTLTLFATCLGPFALSITMNDAVQSTTELAEQRLAYRLNETQPDQELIELNPDYQFLSDLEPQKGEDIGSHLLMISVGGAATKGIYIGLLTSAVLCLVTCIGGTLFANNLYVEQRRMLPAIMPYFEFGVLLLVVAIMLYALEVNPRWRTSYDKFPLPPLSFRLKAFATVVVPLIVAYRRWWCVWRWLIYVACATVLAIVVGWVRLHA